MMTLERLKILVVDDESRMRKLVKDFLVKAGYDVVEAGDGEEALDIFFENVHQSRSRFKACPGDMRRDETIYRPDERIVLFRRLTGKHVNTCSGYCAAVKGGS